MLTARSVLELYLTGWEGMLRQYSEAKTIDVPAGRDGMYVKEFSTQADWMHHGEGLQLFNRMALSVPTLPAYRQRAQRFAGFYMGEDPDAPNYDPAHKLIRSTLNGSKGPMLRNATALDWGGRSVRLADRSIAGGGMRTGGDSVRSIRSRANAKTATAFRARSWASATRSLSRAVNARDFSVQLDPTAGATLTLAMRRYVDTPTVAFPWDR